MRKTILTWAAPLFPLCVALGVTLATGCTATEPTTDPTGTHTSSSSSDFHPPPPADMAKPDDGHVEPPTLDAITNLTNYYTVPVHGTGEPGSTVLIKAMDGSTIAAEVMSSGRFCADLPLTKSTMNVFELRAIDGNGNQSDPVTLQVEQKGSPTVAGVSRPREDLALGGAISSTLSWNAGSAASIHDGDANNYAGAWQRGFSETDSVVVALSDRRQVDRIRLRAPASCPLTAHFQIYVSNADAPSDPSTSTMQWTLAKDVAGNAGTDYILNFTQAVTMNHVALYFDRGLVAWGASDINCGNEWTWGAYYEFSEIEAWSVANVVPPPPAAPTCGGGGGVN